MYVAFQLTVRDTIPRESTLREQTSEATKKCAEHKSPATPPQLPFRNIEPQ